MPRVVTKQTALELYLKSYFKTNARKRIEKTYVRKALALVNEKLGIPCCENPNATINLFTRFNNNFSNGVQMLLTGMTKTGNVKSLERSRDILENYITPPCCG